MKFFRNAAAAGFLLAGLALQGTDAETATLMELNMEKHEEDGRWFTEFKRENMDKILDEESGRKYFDTPPGPAKCENGFANENFACNGIDKLGFISLRDMGSKLPDVAPENSTVDTTIKSSDLWGWEDPETGREYVLSGVKDGLSIVDITVPETPQAVFWIEDEFEIGRGNNWKDVKVFKDHVFWVSENPLHNFRVFDLRNVRKKLPTDPLEEVEPTLIIEAYGGRAHNLVINEDTGIAYAVGLSNSTNKDGTGVCRNGGKQYMFDINDPSDIKDLGCWEGDGDDGYSHDCQIVTYSGPDTRYTGREIALCNNEDTVTISDVTDKTDIKILSRWSYWIAAGEEEFPEALFNYKSGPRNRTGYVHQGWLNDDQSLFLCDDEIDELAYEQYQSYQDNPKPLKNAATIVVDVTNLEDPKLKFIYRHTVLSIDHNLYTRKAFGLGELAYHSNYASGLRITNITEAASTGKMETIAYYDICPEINEELKFVGTWSNYPYFKSRTIAVNGMYRGLFLLRHTVDTGATASPTASPTSPTAPTVSAASSLALIQTQVVVTLLFIASLL